MKTVACAAAATFLGAVFMSRALATPDFAQPDPDANPYSQQDAEGVPLFVHDQKTRSQPSDEEIEARRESEQKAQQDQDWLLKNYEQQQRLRSFNGSGGKENDLYYQITTDKTLSQLAGLPMTEEQQQIALKIGLDPAVKGTLALRTDSSPTGPSASNPKLTTYKPLITPLDGSVTSHLFSTLSSPSSKPASPAPPAPAPDPSSDDLARDPAAIENPGQTAADDNPLLRDKYDRLTFDMSLDEPLPHQGSHQSSSSKLELPAATNDAQMQLQTANSLYVPGTSKTASKPPPASSLQYKLSDEQPGAFKTDSPAPPPGRQRIADPHDIFYH